MTISGIICCFILSSVIGTAIGALLYTETESRAVMIIAIVLTCVIIFGAGFWYYGYTASGQRELTDERANLSNGLERTITVYTADGTVLKQYKGRIDIEQDQGYVKFDWNGKRYIYYNCYVETIADIP